MAKYIERIQARELRKKGVSVIQIAKKLKVSKGTASLWVRDIILTLEQLENLRQQNIRGGEKGRILGALKQKNNRLKRIQDGIIKGEKLFKTLSLHELMISGLSLYWAEGSKKTKSVMFCNSDPKLINFMIKWLQKCFNIPLERLYCTVGINEIHRKRESIVKKYWSENTGIPLSRFKKTSFKKVKNKKVYKNYNEHYGTLAVQLAQPGQLYYDILGLISGLALSINKLPA